MKRRFSDVLNAKNAEREKKREAGMTTSMFMKDGCRGVHEFHDGSSGTKMTRANVIPFRVLPDQSGHHSSRSPRKLYCVA